MSSTNLDTLTSLTFPFLPPTTCLLCWLSMSAFYVVAQKKHFIFISDYIFTTAGEPLVEEDCFFFFIM